MTSQPDMQGLDPKALEAAQDVAENNDGYGRRAVVEAAISACLASLRSGREAGDRRVTMWAEVVQTYEADGVEWRCHEESGRDPEERPVIELAADTFPLGTKIEISEPAAAIRNLAGTKTNG